MNAIAAQWRSRSESERKRWGAIAAVVAIVLLVALVWLPMKREAARLETELPDMRAATATMQRQAAQVAILLAAPPRGAAAAQALASVATALAPSLPGAQVAALDERRLRVAASDVAWGSLLEWIANAKAQHGLDVTVARVEALAVPGRVKADLTLERP